MGIGATLLLLLIPLLSATILVVGVPQLQHMVDSHQLRLRWLPIVGIGLGSALIGYWVFQLLVTCASWLPACNRVGQLGELAWQIWKPLKLFIFSSNEVWLKQGNAGASGLAEFTDGALLGLVLSAIVWGSQRLWAFLSKARRRKVSMWRVKGNALREMFVESMYEGREVIVTTSNRKAYVGAIKNPGVEGDYILILPSKSGYRSERNLNLTIVNDYEPVFTAAREALEQLKPVIEKYLIGETKSLPFSDVKLKVTYPNERVQITTAHELIAQIDSLGVLVPIEDIHSAAIWNPFLYPDDVPSDDVSVEATVLNGVPVMLQDGDEE